MPVGSPGMDGPAYNGRKDPYDVLLVTRNVMNSECPRAFSPVTGEAGQRRAHTHNPPMTHPSLQGAITDVAGIEVGHYTETRRPTGCSVVIARDGAVGGVDVRGAVPGTRETELAAPVELRRARACRHAFAAVPGGWDAASGAARWLEEQGVGFDIGVGRLPLVPAAVLFDLHVGDARVRPDAAAGYAACAAATRAHPAEGCVGAGNGATVGKLFGMQYAMKSGIGTASVRVDGITVGALVACNAVGDVVHPDTGRPLAGARTEDGTQLRDMRRALLRR